MSGLQRAIAIDPAFAMAGQSAQGHDPAIQPADHFLIAGVVVGKHDAHHPIPVDIPSWYAKPFYERVLGSWFEKTDELEDAESFLRFVETRGFQAIFHGHKHIPRIGFTPVLKVPIFGCGSSVGKVITDKKDTFISINTYRYNVEKRILSGRLLAERLAGEGLSELTRHEVICRKT